MRNPQAKTSAGKLKLTITLDPDQCAIIDRLADARRTSRSSIVRLAIDFYLARIMDNIHTDHPRSVTENPDAA